MPMILLYFCYILGALFTNILYCVSFYLDDVTVRMIYETELVTEN